MALSRAAGEGPAARTYGLPVLAIRGGQRAQHSRQEPVLAGKMEDHDTGREASLLGDVRQCQGSIALPGKSRNGGIDQLGAPDISRRLAWQRRVNAPERRHLRENRV